MPFPDMVAELVERFESNREACRSDQYNEAQLRQEFINPFFTALGWDMDNKAGYAQAYKDVIHEDSLKVSGGTKAPDYCFRIGGARKFFVEAKKPSVNLRDDPSPAFQLRRYAWSAKLPLSILTDFEECAVYDCRVKPASADKAATARISYITYKDYAAKWDEIAAVFSRDAILKGAFDKYAESTSGKRGTAEVDDAFLRDIESWRDSLAHNLALRNPGLSQRELNFAVQRTIDRIIFLRICEDRGIESYAGLRVLLNGARVYPRLTEMFRAADDRYNSGLFHFGAEKGRPETPDELTLSLAIDDKPLKDIIRNLYYPDSPYEFSVLPADILGQVYEQFLGKVIRLTPGHQAKVEDKPEVKKAGGVYYTPTYIVDYIVANTVGKLVEGKSSGMMSITRHPELDSGPPEVLKQVQHDVVLTKSEQLLVEGKTPKQVEKLRILDPACGSGSFLIGAYQYLLDWHRDWYVADNPQKWARGSARIYDAGGSDWRLTNGERKRILLNNIYGVDIDSQAVEVTKLSLLLKIIEGGAQLALAGERMLPDLGSNIKCGNSLIGPDFYAGQQMTLLGDDERLRVNVFDWNAEFSEVMKAGGFDAVIGNPPWGGGIDRELWYYHAHYADSTKEHTDSFKLFVDRAIHLARSGGFSAMIVPNTLLRQRRLRDVRSVMLRYRIACIADLGEDVFRGVVAPSCVFVLSKGEAVPLQDVELLHLAALPPSQKGPAMRDRYGAATSCPQSSFANNPDLEFAIPSVTHRVVTICLSHFSAFELRDAGINYQRKNVGMQAKGSGDLAKRLLYEGPQQGPRDMMYWKGTDIGRYRIAQQTNRFCRTNYAEFIRSNEVVHLSPNIYQQKPKLLLRQTADRIMATLDSSGVWFGRSVIALVPKTTTEYSPQYLLGLLDSRYFVWLYHGLAQERGRVFAQVKLSKLGQLPIRPISFPDPADKARHDRMVALVDQMLSLHKQLAEAKLDDQKTAIQRQIDFTDRQIDLLVYELYGLNESEIAIVESAQEPPSRAGKTTPEAS